MYDQFFFHQAFLPMMVFNHVLFYFLLVVMVAWILVWKGLALWYSARNGQKIWFVANLVFNTFGILQIVYLIWFRKGRPRTRSAFAARRGTAPAEKSGE